MKKKLRKYIILPLLAVLWLCGCGKKEETDTETVYADREKNQELAWDSVVSGKLRRKTL